MEVILVVVVVVVVVVIVDVVILVVVVMVSSDSSSSIILFIHIGYQRMHNLRYRSPRWRYPSLSYCILTLNEQQRIS